MKLIELRANKDSFRTVTFNPTGISLITAVRKTDDEKKTYNSVGKSLLITLVHFCLGSNPNEELEKKLNDWEFSLDFEIDGETCTATRNTADQKNISLNDDTMSLNKFRKELEDKVFQIPEETKFLKFRSLISRFIRPRKSSYVSYNDFVKKEQPIAQLINNAFLLGIEPSRIIKKYDMKKQFDKIDEMRTQFNKDTVIKSFFHQENESDIDIKIVEYETKIKRLSENIESFRIAEDYDDIRIEADEISAQLRTIKNHASSLRNAVTNINKSLEIQADISPSDIKKFYDKAKVQLSEMVIKRLDELKVFNEKLLGNRTEKLMQDKTRFEKRLGEIQKEIQRLGLLENEKLQYLNTHGALDEYTQLNRQLSDVEKQLDKLVQYKKLVEEYKTQLEGIKKAFSNENIDTNKYLKETEEIIKENIILFKLFAERFYDRKTTGISVVSNDKINQTRYEIKAKIPDDAGDAVNEVKIFCFDWTLLEAQHGHNVKFLFHDSRITDGMDTRQVGTIFKVAHEISNKKGYQYIISANQNLLDSLKEEFSEEEYDEMIIKNTILELSDKSDESRLLGIQVDLNYEKDDE